MVSRYVFLSKFLVRDEELRRRSISGIAMVLSDVVICATINGLLRWVFQTFKAICITIGYSSQHR